MGHIVRSSHLANCLSKSCEVGVAFDARRLELIPDWLLARRLPLKQTDLRDVSPVEASGFQADVFVLDVMFPRDDWLRSCPRSVVIVGAGWSITEEIAAAASLLIYQTGFHVKHHYLVPSLSGPDYLMLGPAYGRRGGAKEREPLVSFGAGIPESYQVALLRAFPDALVPEPGEMLYGLQRAAPVHAGSLGMSTYESMSLGCVPVVVSRSTDHQETAAKLDAMGVVVDCGILADCPSRDMVPVVRDVLLDDRRRAVLAEAGQDLVDGKGLARVAKAVLNV
jgi:hypothetical protein